MTLIAPAARRRRRILTRAAPLGAVAVASFALGLVASGGVEERSPGDRYAAAWAAGDFAAMHAELTPQSRTDHPLDRFRRLHERAARTATVASTTATGGGEGEVDGNRVEIVETRVTTHAFGVIDGELLLPASDRGVDWAPHLAFPGLEPGEELVRRTRAPERAPILAEDGTVLASGPADERALPEGSAAAAVVGELGSPPPVQDRERQRLGFPAGAPAGVSGLELAYDERLSGTPGGELVAVPANGGGEPRVLATGEPRAGRRVRTTIDAGLQQAAVDALGGLFGGVAVLDARRGSVRALAGAAFTAPQPPGSTFKVITAVAALDAGAVSPGDEFPIEATNADIGREIRNSDEQPCGGTFVASFAQSCNTVFAPLGAEVGGEELVAVSEAFGFNSPPPLHGPEASAAIDPPQSRIPPDLSGSVAVGESAIGQGEVLATPLQMASVAQTIANRGVRMPTSIVRGELAPDAERVRVTSPRTARILDEMMVEVVESGTGAAAALADVAVAGKTGTAELGPSPFEPGEEPEQELDAWFTAYAPAADPELAVAVMVVNSEGGGGAVAAPIARAVLEAGLNG